MGKWTEIRTVFSLLPIKVQNGRTRIWTVSVRKIVGPYLILSLTKTCYITMLYMVNQKELSTWLS